MLRLITCQNATLLLERQSDRSLPVLARLGLRLHLHYCPYCRRYARQTVLIAAWARAAAAGRVSGGAGLSAEAKERMRRQLAAGR